MLSINPGCKSVFESAHGWKNPFGRDESKWLENQQRPEPDTLEHVAYVIQNVFWSPFLYEGEHRHTDHFLEAHWIGLDFDSGKSLSWAVREFKDHAAIIGTTKSHQLSKGSQPACDRFRVLLRLASATRSREDLRATLEAVINRYGSDAACKDAARSFVPCRDIVFVGSEDGLRTPIQRPPSTLDYRSRNFTQNQFKRPSGPSVTDLVTGAGFREGGRNAAVNRAAFALFAPYYQHSMDYVYAFIRPLTDLPEGELLATLKSAKESRNARSTHNRVE